MHTHPHAFTSLLGRVQEGLVVSSRRNFLKAGLAGLAGLSLPGLLRRQALAGTPAGNGKSVLLLWMAGGRTVPRFPGAMGSGQRWSVDW